MQELSKKFKRELDQTKEKMLTETNDQVNGFKTKIAEMETELLEANVNQLFMLYDQNLIVYTFHFNPAFRNYPKNSSVSQIKLKKICLQKQMIKLMVIK